MTNILNDFTSNWYALAIASALSLGLYDLCKKLAVAKNRVMPVLFWATLAGTIFMVGATVAGGNWHLFRCTWQEWLLVLLKSTIVAVSWIAGYFALHDLPISIAAPVRASAPVWAVCGGVLFFGERPSWMQLLGMAVVFTGYWLFSNVGRAEGFSWRNRGVRMVIAATLAGAGSALYDRFLMGTLRLDPNMVQLHFSIDLVALLGLAWLLQPRVAFMAEEQPFRWRWAIPAIGVLLIAADWLFFHAIAVPGSQIGVLSVLRRCSVAVSFLAGAWYFRERFLAKKSLALLFVIAGVIILGIFK